jgi:hypothetical protein
MGAKEGSWRALRTKIQPHARVILPLLAHGNVQRCVSSQAIPDVRIAAVVVQDMLKDIGGAVQNAGVS